MADGVDGTSFNLGSLFKNVGKGLGTVAKGSYEAAATIGEFSRQNTKALKAQGKGKRKSESEELMMDPSKMRIL